ncbi:hypothetical protein AMATHDRAFT_145129, partial [Amanita thiersii Skay4041]
SRGVKRKRDTQDEIVNELRLLAPILRHAPSSFSTPSVFFDEDVANIVLCNRPFKFDTIPITLFQEEFGQFQDDCMMNPSSKVQELLKVLTVAVCKSYSSENKRGDIISNIFEAHANVYLLAKIQMTEYITDGNLRSKVMPAVILECKNESECALFQAIARYVQFLKMQVTYFRNTRFPCVLMTVVGFENGSCIGFYGCLWTGQKLHVKLLAPVYDLATPWEDEVDRRNIAAGLQAFLNIIPRIDAHHTSLSKLPLQKRTYPYKTDYRDESGQQINFRYTERIEKKLVFAARTDEGAPLIVKFTRHYSADAHRFLAQLGHAPQLRAVTALPGGWKMIVLDFSRYIALEDIPFSFESQSIVISRVSEILHKLHNYGYVHGDVRSINILVDPGTLTNTTGCAIHLLDFDWAAKIGEATYPMRINTTTVRRPKGVTDGQLITAEHDMEMVQWLF